MLDVLAFLSALAQIPAQEASISRQQTAIAAQKASVRRQLAGVRAAPAEPAGDFFVTLPELTPSPADCDPLPVMQQHAITQAAARKNGVDATLLDAVIRQESGFRPCSVSPKGALGLMQLMPATAESFAVADPLDPRENVEAGAALLKQLLTRYSGDLNRALAAYNAGTARVDAADGIPAFTETMGYVGGILEKLERAKSGRKP